MSRHEPATPRAEPAAPVAAIAAAAPAPAPPMVTLIGGACDGQRVARPDGTAIIARAGAAQEAYILSRAFLTSGQPVEIWHARFMPPGEALARALDAYPRPRAAA